MNRWQSFVEFVEMRERGDTDACYRNYNLLKSATIRTLRMSMRRAGFSAEDASRLNVAVVQQQLTNVGTTVDRATCIIYLNEWWVWDRINCGEVIKWAYRFGRNASQDIARTECTV